MNALEIFRMVAKEFDSLPDEDVVNDDGKVTQHGVKSFIELYSDQISEKRFGASYQKALAYLTAHKLKMNGYGDTGTGTIADSLRVTKPASWARGKAQGNREWEIAVGEGQFK